MKETHQLLGVLFKQHFDGKIHVNKLSSEEFPNREEYFFGSLPRTLIRSLLTLYKVDFDILGITDRVSSSVSKSKSSFGKKEAYFESFRRKKAATFAM